ncbi:hypothetical protein SUGI_0442480 [Cryptomeria japonica]|nr:hypothetical protein SUGI_0442480 [Cryptomeria japonica]
MLSNMRAQAYRLKPLRAKFALGHNFDHIPYDVRAITLGSPLMGSFETIQLHQIDHYNLNLGQEEKCILLWSSASCKNISNYRIANQSPGPDCNLQMKFQLINCNPFRNPNIAKRSSNPNPHLLFVHFLPEPRIVTEFETPRVRVCIWKSCRI